MCASGGPARGMGWHTPGTTWTAEMTDLAPGDTYWYTVGSDDGGWSHTRINTSFVMPAVNVPAVSAPRAPVWARASARQLAESPRVRIAAFGDMGKARAAFLIRNRVRRPTFLIWQAPSAWDGSLLHSWDNDDRGEVGSWNTTRLLRTEVIGPTGPSNSPSAEPRASPVMSPELVLHIGDVSYAVGYLSEWDDFMEQARSRSRRENSPRRSRRWHL